MEVDKPEVGDVDPFDNVDFDWDPQSDMQPTSLRQQPMDSDINMILCPLCQTPIEPNPANMCVKCLNAQIDISEGISKQLVLFQCRQCERWFKNPQYVEAEFETPQLLAVCIKKVRGLPRVKLVDAKWIWTEPHSRRLLIELTIQKEVFNGAIIQKKFPVEFTIANQQCKECQASFTHHTWRANVQVRQKVTHKRTFLFLEQIILKHNLTANCMGISEERDGIDFFFPGRSEAQSFQDFLHSVVPVETRHSKRLISQDPKSNKSKYKYTFFAELAPVCRNDLVVIPPKLRNRCGGRSPLMICYKVTQSLHFVDPTTLHNIELDSKQYFKGQFGSIGSQYETTKFFVMNMKHMKIKRGRFQLAELELVRECDLGDPTAPVFETVTHLGGIIRTGDIVEGYDMHTLSSAVDLQNDRDFIKATRKLKIPEVIVVKKFYHRRNRHLRRKWKLKSMVKYRKYNTDKRMAANDQRDNEAFMRELEEDFDFRCRINIYKDHERLARKRDDDTSSVATTEGGEVPKIPMEELLDDLESMQLLADAANPPGTTEGDEQNPILQSAAVDNEGDDAEMMPID